MRSTAANWLGWGLIPTLENRGQVLCRSRHRHSLLVDRQDYYLANIASLTAHHYNLGFCFRLGMLVAFLKRPGATTY